MLPWILLILQALCVHGQPGGLLDPSQLIEGAWSLHPTVSVGSVRRGRVLFGKKLESDEWIYVKDPNGSWVVDPAPKVLRELSQSIKAQYPDFDRLVINDGSVRHGGIYRPHRTHQSGRDIDIRYLLKGSVKGDYTFRFVTPANFDTERNWAIVKWLYDSGQVSRILMDHGHQKRLWKYARKRLKLSRAEIAPILSYPYRQRGALVRHARGHYNHFHVSLKASTARKLGRAWSLQEAKRLQDTADKLFGWKFPHVVRKGETYQRIANRYGVTVEQIKRWNATGERGRLSIGATLLLKPPQAQ